MHETAKQAETEDGTVRGDFSEQVLGIVLKLYHDLTPGKRRVHTVTLDSDLDRDVGLDSLARAELIFRLDRAFGVKLPDKVLVEATTPRDLVKALNLAVPKLDATQTLAESGYASLGKVDEPALANTLIEALRFHVDHHADRPHIRVWLSENQQEEITYGDLHREALRTAFGLIGLGVKPCDHVAIMLPTSREFFFAFCGVLYAGAVPVPIYPPFRPSQVEDHLRRQAKILNDSNAKVLIMSEEIRVVGALLFGLSKDLRHIVTTAEISDQGALGKPVLSQANKTALIQYTSGSTGDPKGVVLTHANLLANIRAMGAALEADSSDVFVSWLPLYHDMGLIGAWLGSLYYGVHTIIMPPLAFLADPSRWLRVIHEHRATLSAGPNFAFELCCKNIRKEQIEGLDLSSLRLLVNGAEPVSAKTIQKFTDAFEPYGFRPHMMGPVYGLAENSVGLAFPPLGRKPPVDLVDRELLSTECRAKPAKKGDSSALAIVACGRPIPHNQIRIVDDAGRELPDRYEGRIQFQSPSATAGYYQNEEKNKNLFDNGWLDTGDRGYLYKGDIHITGRVKDIIIKAGRNIYPQEMEELVGEIEGVRKGCIAAVASADPRSGTEKLVLVAESYIDNEQELAALREKISEACNLRLDVAPDVVELVPPRTVPKTSSGKIRRAATRELYEKGHLVRRGSGLWWQLVRLWFGGLGIRTRRASNQLTDLLFAGYWWMLLVLMGIFVWIGALIMPTRRLSQALVHRVARLFLLLTGATPDVHMDKAIPQSDCILAATHSSYLDALVLSAVLEGEIAFVAKHELAKQYVAGPLLRKIGTIFVRRTSTAGSLEDTDTIAAAERSGKRIVIFPEATFRRMPGVLPFRMGAFLTAAQTGKPIIPVVLSGTDTILRGEQWFPRRGRPKVWIGEPLLARGNDFSAAIVLRDNVRAIFIERSGKPDLASEHVELAPSEQHDGFDGGA